MFEPIRHNSADLAPNDFHLFRSLQNALNDKKKTSLEDQGKILVENLSLKPAEYNLKGINKQVDKWQEMIQNNDEYTID